MRRENMKRENMKRLYTKDNCENLIWIRTMEADPNTVFITNILNHITGDIMPVNKYKLNLITHEIENLGQELMQYVEEEALSFIDFTHNPVDDVSGTGVKDYFIINLKSSYARGFYIWVTLDNQMKIFSIDNDGTIRFDHFVLDKQTMNMFIDSGKLFKFTLYKR